MIPLQRAVHRGSREPGSKLGFVTGLRCTACGKLHQPEPSLSSYTCKDCGVTGILDVVYDYAAIARVLTPAALAVRPLDQWRYRELLPIREGATLPDLTVGWTPLTIAPALAEHVGVRALYLKDEGRGPTGSMKDRPSALAVVAAVERRKKIVSCASTGNAASSLAGMAASMGLKSVIFLPEHAPEPKIAQLLIFGATVVRVRGSYEDAFQLCQKSCGKWRWYNRNAAVNPYLVEGKKTVSLEIAEQFGFRPPDWVAVSVGDGCTIAGVWKGFRELKELGLIARTPRILGVQAAGAAPVTEAFRTGKLLQPIVPHTMADSIAVGVPRNWKKAVLAVTESGGTMINVEDDEIFEAMRYTGRLSGVFAEPAAAASVAGLRRAVQERVVSPKATVAAIVTGNGLKDIKSAQRAAGEPFNVLPDGNGLEFILESRGLIGSKQGGR
jgi:threonine synthase